MCAFRADWVWVTNWCARPQGRLSSPALSFPQLPVILYVGLRPLRLSRNLKESKKVYWRGLGGRKGNDALSQKKKKNEIT